MVEQITTYLFFKAGFKTSDKMTLSASYESLSGDDGKDAKKLENLCANFLPFSDGISYQNHDIWLP